MVHSSCRSICHSSKPQTSTVHVSSPRPKCLGYRCCEHKLDGSHCLCIPSKGSPSQGDPKNQAMPLPDHCNSPRLARDALVLGPSAALNRDPTSTSSVNNSSQTVPQLCVPQQPTTSQPPCLVSRSGKLQEQGFSVEVAERIAAPPRSSTRTTLRFSQGSSQKFQKSPKLNLSVVINELTKGPFEPMKDTDLKHFTLKTAFLLALASSKRRCKLHAWVANTVSNLGQWKKVPLFRFHSQKPTSQLLTIFPT